MAQRGGGGVGQVPRVAETIISITNLSNVRKRQIVSCCLAADHDGGQLCTLREGREASARGALIRICK